MKDKIFDAIILLSGEKTISNITIRDIAKASNISVGSIYNNFTDKDEIISQLYLKLKVELNETVEASYDGSFSSIINGYISYGFNHKLKFNFMQAKDVVMVLNEDVISNVDVIYSSVVDRIETANDSQVMSLIILGAIHQYIATYEQRDLDVERKLLANFELVLNNK